MSSLHDFFYEFIGAALRGHNIQLSTTAEWYLMQVLTNQSKAELPPDEPLGFQIARAQEAPLSQKPSQLRSIGDTALMLSGFFLEYIRYHKIDPSYYMDIGSAAYDEAGNILNAIASREQLSKTLHEMASHFHRLASCLAEAREESIVRGLDLIGLLEYWSKTHSDTAAKYLQKSCVVLPKNNQEFLC